VTLDEDLRAGLRRQDKTALATWRALCAVVRFYEDHPEWRTLIPAGPLAILQDVKPPEPDLFDEALNLIARRQVPYRVIERSDFKADSLREFSGVVASGLQAPTAAEQQCIRQVEKKGGVVLDADDPETLSRDARELLGPDLPVKVFNVPSVLSYVANAPEGLVIHLVNYASELARGGMLRVKGPHRKAAFHTPGQPVRPLKLEEAEGSVEMALPDFQAAAAIVMSR
jgi:hypothetical protein